MPGKKPRLKPLEARKQLLLAESELNRARLLQEWSGLKGEVHRLTRQARTVGSFASLAATVMTVYSTRRHGPPGPDGGKSGSPWISTWLNNARMAASLWVALKSCFPQARWGREGRTR